MIVVLQRVSEASVSVAGEVVGEIERGHLLLVGFGDEDQERLGSIRAGSPRASPEEEPAERDPPATESMDEVLQWMARKVVELRVFPDEDGRMNRSLEDIDGSLLVVSQFTLYGDTRKGRRPSFVHAAAPGVAESLYDSFVDRLDSLVPDRVRSGEFGAMMDVSLVNDGPVTLVLER